MTAIAILTGLCLLTMGRRIFWLFVGLVGFITAFGLVQQVGLHPNEWVLWGIALAGGVVGAVVAIFFQRLAVGLAGFAGGAIIGVFLLELFAISLQQWQWLAALGGGIIGMVALFLLFDWALILISAILGANLIVLPLNGGPGETLLGIILLTTAGVYIQAKRKPKA